VRRQTRELRPDGVEHVVGRLTPYEVETLTLNAQTFPAGSRLELTIRGRVADDVLDTVRAEFASLAAHGVEVIVQRADRASARRRPSPERPVEAPSQPVRGRRVLVAEDDPDMRRLIAALLRMAGHKVIEAEDGSDVVDRLESTIWSEHPELIDVIVSDVQMPGLSGLDVLAALRCSNRKTPVVLITAFGNDTIRAEARELGAAAILDKPLDPDALKAAVAAA
jgi:CheY-like chemotaxis protein